MQALSGPPNDVSIFEVSPNPRAVIFFEHQSVARYDKTYNAVTEKRRIMDWMVGLPRPVAIMGCYDFQSAGGA